MLVRPSALCSKESEDGIQAELEGELEVFLTGASGPQAQGASKAFFFLVGHEVNR